MKWVPLSESDIPQQPGIRKIKVEGRLLCVIRDGSHLRVTSSRCPHAGADLSQGWCAEGKLICPYHRHAFSLETGRGDPGQGNYIQVYPLEQRNGIWYVGIRTGWLKQLFNLNMH